MNAKKKGGGSSLTRSQIVTVRLDPKLKFAAELAARKQRRTISSFIEWAVEEAIEGIGISGKLNVKEIVNKVWDVEEHERLVKLASNYPDLLTFDEERLWKIIKEYPGFWKKMEFNLGDREVQRIPSNDKILDSAALRAKWHILQKIINGEAEINDLADTPD